MTGTRGYRQAVVGLPESFDESEAFAEGFWACAVTREKGRSEGGIGLVDWIGPGLAISMSLECLLFLIVQRNGMAKCAVYIDIYLLWNRTLCEVIRLANTLRMPCERLASGFESVFEVAFRAVLIRG